MHDWSVVYLTTDCFLVSVLFVIPKPRPNDRSYLPFRYKFLIFYLSWCLFCVGVLRGVLLCLMLFHACICYCYSTPLVAPSSDLGDVNRLLKSGLCDIGDIQNKKISINRRLLSYYMYRHITQPYFLLVQKDSILCYEDFLIQII